MKNRIKYMLIAFGALLVSCDNYLGDETDLSFIEVPEQTYREVAYVPVQPILNQFVYPTDVIAGFDELIYVVDQGTSEIIAMDESGRELSRKSVPGAKAIAQRRDLDLLVIGTFIDTTNGLNLERSCIYRLDLSSAFGYGLNFARYTDTIIHPLYFKTTAATRDTAVKFVRLSVLQDNSFYVVRTGPNNRATQAGGPDDAVLLFDPDGKFQTPITISDNRGAIFTDYFKKPFAISTLVKPPQVSVDLRGDFIISSLDPEGVLKVQQIEKLESVDGIAYRPKTDWSIDRTQADRFINEPFKFIEPTGVEYAGDGTNFIFVVDKAKDSLFQFTANGLEGIQPPPASGETKYVRASFGGTGIGPLQFNQPMAVAYKDRIVYVADAGNGRLLRFILTLDIR